LGAELDKYYGPNRRDGKGAKGKGVWGDSGKTRRKRNPVLKTSRNLERPSHEGFLAELGGWGVVVKDVYDTGLKREILCILKTTKEGMRKGDWWVFRRAIQGNAGEGTYKPVANGDLREKRGNANVFANFLRKRIVAHCGGK